MKKKIFLLSLMILFILSTCIYISFFKSSNLTFRLPILYNKNIPILVENIPVIKKGNLLVPITATITRPVSISVGNQQKEVKINHLSKTNLIPIDIVFQNETFHYFLQTLPDTFPQYDIKNFLNQEGYVLISLHGMNLVDPSYSFILDMDGNVIYYRGHPKVNQSMFHLKKVALPNGKIRYTTHVQDGWGLDNSYVVGYHLIMDENFHELDRVKVLKTEKHDALLADEHDILMLDDGHYIVIGQDIVETVLPDGKRSLVTHSVIQEQKNGKVLLDWDSKEHPELQKACYEKCPEIHDYNADYIHTNSLFIDPMDNNLLVSAASGYYIMKLDRKTGKILWILGGKSNQFKMLKESEFIRQHDVQILSDGRLLMFDNHFSSLPQELMKYHKKFFNNQQAQILILGLDEKTKQISSVENIPLNFWSPYMGSVQKLENEEWFIGCGSSGECTARMIDKFGNILWDMKANEPYKMFRAYYYNSLK